MKYLLPLLVCLAACGGNSSPNPTAGTPADTTGQAANGIPSSTPPPSPSPRFPANSVFLEGIYATSTATGHEPDLLFDADTKTTWRTRPGAGPDEGLMLYFAQPRSLQSLTVEAESGSFQGDVAGIQTYVNGQLGDSGKPGQPIALPSVPVKSLFLRFESTGREVESNMRKGNSDISLRSFPRDAFIGLHSLTIRDDKGQQLLLAPPVREEGRVSASSTLAPEGAYSAANLFDARKEFVWAEGNAASDGVGEVLTFSFAHPVSIGSLQVWNGYQRSEEHYAANGRVRDFEFGVKGGPMHTYTLRDSKAGQKIALSAGLSGQEFELKVKSIYKGNSYKDLAISEILFFNKEAQPFVLYSAQPVQLRNALASRSAPSPLAGVLDRRISNQIDDGVQTFTNQSIILRADGTFVFYSSVNDQDDTNVETLADGNWELLEASASAARVKIFGKWRDLDNVAAYYEGQRQAETTRIFKDELTVTAERLVGTKMVGTFYLK